MGIQDDISFTAILVDGYINGWVDSENLTEWVNLIGCGIAIPAIQTLYLCTC